MKTIRKRQQKLLQLIRLLKNIKLSRMININKNVFSKYNVWKNLKNRKSNLLTLRGHYIDVFIENKKKEIDGIRKIMNPINNSKLTDDKNMENKTPIKKKLSLDKQTFVKHITEETVKGITNQVVDKDFLYDAVDEIVENVIEENGNNLNELEIIKLVKEKIQQEDQSPKIKNQYPTNLVVSWDIKKPKISLVENSGKILVIIACHTNNNLRFNAITSIMKYLEEVENIDIVIVNSANTHLSKFVQNAFKSKYFKYLEINNDNYYGFSKWLYGIKNINTDKYKFVTFINDSVLVHANLKHFFDYTRLSDVDLYGYNNSTQICYHYQTYLFSIKTSNLQPFIKMINENKNLVKTYLDAVTHFELKLLDYYPNRDCFLKIAYLPSQKGNNIFFNNDFLYTKLRDSGLLPFTKLKRIS
jgi:hypothetical protein